ncbi:MAG: divalent-cation tolerance protein CutA [Methanomicrobiales archaeon]|jgi:periplasmic divalent cation tolerance protein|nr:divalent-cation tolerance protein CutA [Methanomicrobiales archaeon]
MSSREDIVIVHCTVPEEFSRQMAQEAVTKGLCACVSMTPVVAVYRWEGSLCEDQEILLLMKTTRARVDAVMEWILSVHPYDVPEILAVPVVQGSQLYCEWVMSSVEGGSE